MTGADFGGFILGLVVVAIVAASVVFCSIGSIFGPARSAFVRTGMAARRW
jgi:hypothetical protein